MLRESEPSRYGLRASQAETLRDLAGAGVVVSVAWTADDAFAWLDAQAGPRPSVLPEGWA